MSKDFFRVKKGLNIQPSDPSGISDLEDGDLIIDSTDGNKLKKYNSVKAGFEDVTNPSAAQALNLLTDASFETEDAQFDIAPVGQLFSFEEHGAGAGLYTPTNLQYLQVQNASANTLSISRDENHSSDLQGKQGLLTIWLKTSSEGFKVGVRVDGVDPSQDSIDQLNVKADGKWNKYELPFVFGSTSIGYKVYSDTSQVNSIDIDNVYMGLSPDGYFNNINNVDTDWISYTPSTQGYGTITDVNFYYKRVGESLKVRGYFTTGSVTAVEAQLGLPNSLIISDKNGVDTNVAGSYAYSSSTTANGGLILTTAGDSFINFTTTGVFGAGTNSATTPANANATSGSGTRITLEFEVPIQGWATGRTDATNQQTELTAATANDLVARFDNNGSTVTEVSSNYSGWYDSITRNGLGVVTIDYTSLGLTSLPSYNCETIDLGGTNNYGCRVNGISTTSATFIFYNTANNRVDTEFTFTLEKTGTDVNKSISVVGKFANINDTPLSQFESKGNSGIALTANVTNITFTETRDNLNAWDGDEFTAPRNSMYIFTGNVRFTAASGANLFFYKDTGSGYAQDVILTENNATSFNLEFAKAIYLNKGDKVAIRSNTAATLNNSSTLHHLSITELPDTASIVQNLAADQAIKCQTKFLTSTISTPTVGISDLAFSGLSLNKYYRLHLSGRFSTQSSVGANLTAQHDGDEILRVEDHGRNASGLLSRVMSNQIIFKATNANLTFDTSANGNARLNNGANSTFVQLCELNDFYTETTEW